MLSREELIKARTQEVAVDGGTILIRMLTAGEAFEYRGKDMDADAVLGLLAKSIHEPVLSLEDVRSLPVTTTNQIVAAVFAFNALGPKAVADAQDELKKTTSADLPVNSP